MGRLDPCRQDAGGGREAAAGAARRCAAALDGGFGSAGQLDGRDAGRPAARGRAAQPGGGWRCAAPPARSADGEPEHRAAGYGYIAFWGCSAGRAAIHYSTASPGWQTLQAVREFFAPAQFFEMSDADKLSRPSFESLPAGVSLGSEGFSVSASDGLEVPAIQFETIIVGEPQDGAGPTPPEDGTN